MRRLTLFFLLLAICTSAAWAAEVPIYLMTKPQPSTTSCDQPPAYTSFLTTDEAAYFWWAALDANAGDTFSTEYYNPAGDYYPPSSGAFAPLPKAGNYCFTDAAFFIAGYEPASLPGAWTVILKLNDVEVARLTFEITGEAPPAGAPEITAGGIVNAASNRAGKIACGGFFTIYGNNLGPATPQGVTAFPIQENMGGVVVTVTQGATSRRAYLHYVSATQINAILPSDMPDGGAQVTVTYQGVESNPEPVTVIDSQFGIFSSGGGSGPGIIQNFVSETVQPLNSPSNTARPGQIMILWGTGLGPINTPDNMPAPAANMSVPVEVEVGGVRAVIQYAGRAPHYAGVDNIYFVVPANAPQGCSVPVQVRAGGAWSNTVRMSIEGSGRHCQDWANPFGDMLQNGGKIGVIVLLRGALHGQLQAGQPALDVSLDVALGAFSDIPAGGEMAFSPLLSLPPLGTCVSTERSLDLASLLQDPSTLGLGTGRQLDAGPSLMLSGAGGNISLKQLDAATNPGLYVALGGEIPIEGVSGLPPLFLDGSQFSITGPGGADVGALHASVHMGTPIVWTNRDQLAVIDRASGATVTWRGGDASQVVVIAGGSTNQKTKDSGGFFCLAPGDAGHFTIPAGNLADVPATGSTVSLTDSIGALLVLSLPRTPDLFPAPGLDKGMGLASTAFVSLAQFR